MEIMSFKIGLITLMDSMINVNINVAYFYLEEPVKIVMDKKVTLVDRLQQLYLLMPELYFFYQMNSCVSAPYLN